mmetsp:Transcript_28989/g.46734  ORF Transcript_28989/g.46734 Transcript_28989/m.46734 type:complete len:81 (-) Transcript_28989:1320-1562(-)
MVKLPGGKEQVRCFSLHQCEKEQATLRHWTAEQYSVCEKESSSRLTYDWGTRERYFGDCWGAMVPSRVVPFLKYLQFACH